MKTKYFFIRSAVKILIVLIFISLAGIAQNRVDSLMFNALNQFRASHKLPLLIWDNAIYNEAKAIYEFQLKDTINDTIEDKLPDADYTPVIAGENGEYFWEVVKLDGELDTATINFLTISFISDIDSVPGERLIFQTTANKGALFLDEKVIFTPNPVKNSSVKFFQEWLLTMIIGVSY